jgi:hypothetical protein
MLNTEIRFRMMKADIDLGILNADIDLRMLNADVNLMILKTVTMINSIVDPVKLNTEIVFILRNGEVGLTITMPKADVD